MDMPMDMDMLHEHGHAAWTWTCSMSSDMDNAEWTWKCKHDWHNVHASCQSWLEQLAGLDVCCDSWCAKLNPEPSQGDREVSSSTQPSGCTSPGHTLGWHSSYSTYLDKSLVIGNKELEDRKQSYAKLQELLISRSGLPFMVTDVCPGRWLFSPPKARCIEPEEGKVLQGNLAIQSHLEATSGQQESWGATPQILVVNQRIPDDIVCPRSLVMISHLFVYI
jgi:hypothetical protein